MRNEVTMVEPIPAALSPLMPAGGSGAGIRLTTITLVSLAAGIILGRFSGFEKNPNTRSRGKGTDCSNWRWLGMRLEFTSEVQLRRWERMPRREAVRLLGWFSQKPLVWPPYLRISTRKSALGAEIKKNLSERIAKEPRA